LPQGERRLAAIMYTDIVGYTALGQKNESLSLAVMEEQRKLIRPILARHNGREVKTMGDAFLIEFPSALDAVRCAYDIQRTMRELNFSLPEERRVQMRVGIHLGDVVESQGDISGDAVNVASRIQSLAADGGVCLTRQVYDQVQNKFELFLASLGPRSLKNVSLPVETFHMVMPWEQENASHRAELDRRRIAVLPFANMSPDPGDEYFADGMTDELITALSGIRGLTTVARNSVMKYKASPKGALEVGRELNCGIMLLGSVRKAGNRIRITAQLIDSATEGLMWAQRYDRQLDDLFAIQTEISERVAKELSTHLLESEKLGLERKAPANTEAYTAYLRARYFWNRRTEEDLNAAIKYFEEAIGADPSFAPALAGLADSYSISALFGYARPRVVYPKAMEFALRAVREGGDLAETHASNGEVLMHYMYDWSGASHELERALEINPNYATAHVWRSSSLAVVGRLDEAEAEARRAQEIDPFSVVVMNEVAKDLYYARRYDEAARQFLYSLEVEPDSAYLHKGLAETYAQKSIAVEAVREIEKAIELSGRSPFILDAAACVHAVSGEESKARDLLAEIDELSMKRFVPFYGRAGANVALGEKREALRLLESAYNERSWLIWLNVDPIFDPLRNEEAFRSLLRRMKLESTRGSS